jgi:hypothetical protein
MFEPPVSLYVPLEIDLKTIDSVRLGYHAQMSTSRPPATMSDTGQPHADNGQGERNGMSETWESDKFVASYRNLASFSGSPPNSMAPRQTSR